MVYIATFSQTIYFAYQPTSLPYTQTYTQAILQTHLHHTYLPDPYIPALHTYIPTLPYKPTKPYIPALSLHTYTTPTTTTPYSADWPYHYTPAPRAGSQMVRLRSRRNRYDIGCAPAYIPTLHTNLHTSNPTNAPIPYIPTRVSFQYVHLTSNASTFIQNPT